MAKSPKSDQSNHSMKVPRHAETICCHCRGVMRRRSGGMPGEWPLLMGFLWCSVREICATLDPRLLQP